MTHQEMEEKLTSIYHEFGKTIKDGEPDESVVARAKDWFTYRLYEETDDKEAVESLATQLANMVAQAAEMNKKIKRNEQQSLDEHGQFVFSD